MAFFQYNYNRFLTAQWIVVVLLIPTSAESQSARKSLSPVGHPFPQHTIYTPGTIKPNNVTQQVMDDSVRSFYDRWKARYLKHDCGSSLYYVFDDEQAPTICVSEGQGYGMLITTMMAGYDPNAQTYFDGLYNFYREHPSDINNRLMAWREKTGCVTDTSAGVDAATDGDMDMAFGLLLAHEQWGSGGTINYFQEAKALIAAIMQDEINHETWATKLGDWSVVSEPGYYYGTRTSDFMMDHFRIFQQIMSDSSWQNVIDQCYALIASMQSRYSPLTGLLPDFIVRTNSTPTPASSNYIEAPTDGSYSYNACRDPWRIGVDYLMSGDSRAKDALDKLNAWIRYHTGNDPSQIWSGYHLNGSNVAGNQYNAESFTGPFAVGAMVDPDNQQWLNDLWTFNVSSYDFNSAFYYENTLKLLTMIVVSGNWWQPQFERTISFSGFTWEVKNSTDPVGPGPNYFSLGTDNVWVDNAGYLHLKITHRNNQWYCSEIMLDSSLGYGRYVFHVNSRAGAINENAVLGLFTWDDDSAQAHREIDVEFSRWGDPSDTTNAQFVVQPWDISGNLTRWTMPGLMDSSTNSFNWQHDSVSFLSVKGNVDFAPYQQVNASWKYEGLNIPSPGNEKTHINLWLDQGHIPSDTQEVEVVISKFEFNPRPVLLPNTWQLVSLPRKVTDRSVHSVIPSAVSEAFYYGSSGYTQTDSMEEGSGYWVKLHGITVPQIITGDSILTDSIQVMKGWNLIGSIAVPVKVDNISSEPPAIITSQFFGYRVSYSATDTIQTGHGYWVKVDQTGTLILSSSHMIADAKMIRIVPTVELPPSPPAGAISVRYETPTKFALGQNYPNPFNPSTIISYQLPIDNYVTLKVYNFLGQEVKVLVDGWEQAGSKSAVFNAGGLAAGIYFYQLEAGKFRAFQKMLLIK